MRPGGRRTADRLIPWAAAACVALTAAAMFWPPAGPAALAASSAGLCALALARRPSRRLRFALAAVAVWIFAGVAGALLLADEARSGFGFILVFLFAGPALVIPWAYARTFAAGGGEASRSTDR
jgi:hypothetical protein